MLNFSQNKVLYYIWIFNCVGLGTWRNEGRYTSVHLSDTNIKVGPRSKSTPPQIFWMCAPVQYSVHIHVNLVEKYSRLLAWTGARSIDRYLWVRETSRRMRLDFFFVLRLNPCSFIASANFELSMYSNVSQAKISSCFGLPTTDNQMSCFILCSNIAAWHCKFALRNTSRVTYQKWKCWLGYK